MVGRLGGGAQVWVVCLAFFQLAVLAGYWTAHGIAGIRSLGVRTGLHLALLGAGIASARIPLPDPDGEPVLALVSALGTGLGLPVVALAATSPLLQSEFARSPRGAGRDPYPAYAAGNLGSLLALLMYPAVLEPRLANSTAFAGWWGGLFVVAGLVAVFRSGLGGESGVGGASRGPVPVRERSARVALALVPSAHLGAVTAHLGNELPSFPWLWVIPLVLYLGSFVLVFARSWRPAWLARIAGVHAVLVAVVALVVFLPLRSGGLAVHLAALAAAATLLHGRLAERRPPAPDLTGFYLDLALGGALGGLLVAVVLPVATSWVIEYPAVLVAGCLLRPWSEADREAGSDRPGAGDLLAALVLAGAVGLALASLPRAGDERDVAARVGVLLVGAAVALWQRRRPPRFAALVAVVVGAGQAAFFAPGVLEIRRSFHGVHRVVEDPVTGHRSLFHGTTEHGRQDPVTGEPLAYFHPGSPPARLLGERLPPGSRVAVVGLGIGSMAAWVAAPSRIDFFELDPVVVELARERKWFTHLRQAGERARVVIGDGRLRLAREPTGKYSLVIADAFSSDAVPTHLLTREAFALYRDRTEAGGAILVNTSNRHVRLGAQVAAVARDLGLAARTLTPGVPTPAEEARGHARASWALLARDRETALRWAPPGEGWADLAPEPDDPVWTDEHASLLPYLRW